MFNVIIYSTSEGLTEKYQKWSVVDGWMRISFGDALSAEYLNWNQMRHACNEFKSN